MAIILSQRLTNDASCPNLFSLPIQIRLEDGKPILKNVMTDAINLPMFDTFLQCYISLVCYRLVATSLIVLVFSFLNIQQVGTVTEELG